MKPIKTDSCVNFADHCMVDVRYLFGFYRTLEKGQLKLWIQRAELKMLNGIS